MTIPETDTALDRLNAVERDLLALLGRGHTAKSIANLHAMTEAAVNERFRSARRKTGIGSSREIARLIVARENRHDFIDLARPAAPSPELQRQAAPRRAAPPRWRLPMTAAVLLAAAILAQQTSVAPTPQPEAERQVPAVAEALFAPRSPDADISALHAEVMGGGVDPAWSAATEAALSRIYEQAIDPASALASLDVTCSASLCEALGIGRPGLTDDALTIFTEAVQGSDVNRAGVALGLHSVVNGFTVTRDNSANGEPSVMIFAAYWRRAD